MFGNLLGSLSSTVGKLDPKKRDEFQAIMAGCLLVAKADGQISGAEGRAIMERLQNHPSLAPVYGVDAIIKEFNRLRAKLDADEFMGPMELEGELRDMQSQPDAARRVFACILSVASKDGGIDDKEREVLRNIEGILGVTGIRY